MDDIQFKRSYSGLIDPASAIRTQQPKTNGPKPVQTGKSFAQVLSESVQNSGLTFSKHALQRMDARRISVSPQLLSQMGDAVEKAKAKGVKDALILNGGTAFIVNVPSGTVVTTMNGAEMKENIFTNIDGAVIL